MKKFLIFFMICFCALFSNAQVKNKYGQDVVRKIEVYGDFDITKPYIFIEFNYSNSLSLEEIILNAPSSGKIFWKMKEDVLTRIEYDVNGKIRKDLVYKYNINDGLVTKCVIDNIGLEDNVLRFLYVYEYDDTNRLISEYKRDFFRESYENFVELSDRYCEVFEWDVDNRVFTSGQITWQWKIGQKFNGLIQYNNRKYYDELLNQTNIDLPMLYNNTVSCDRFERVTEWCGKHSRRLIEKDNAIYFDYIYDNESGGNDLGDTRGKITQMDVYNGKHLEKTYKIYYWE